MSLEAVWGRLGKLKKQKQGTCGLYSFWYATLLLDALGVGKGIVYPRHCVGGTGESSRHFAKQNVNSGQGEVLSEWEMATIVEHYGYTATCYDPTSPNRRAFITRHLNADQPILIPYLMDNDPEVVTKRAVYGGGDGCGAHWSLIIGESRDEYRYLEPNVPNQITTCDKTQLLASNACVDMVKFVQYWNKPQRHGLQGLGDCFFLSKLRSIGYTMYDVRAEVPAAPSTRCSSP